MSSNLNKSKISRSWPLTFGYLGAGVVIAGIGLSIFMFTSGGAWLGASAVAAFIIAGICFYMALTGAGVCACPGCGNEIGGVSTGKNEGILCAKCRRYFEGRGGQLWATEESKVAASPVFSSPLPEAFGFPDGCCVCGKPETHRVTVSMSTQGGGNVALQAATGIRTATRTSVAVPHCAEHKDGALLGGTKNSPTIRFRSYPYLRAFCELNKTTPC